MIYFSCRVQEGHITVAERQGWGLKLNWADITEKSFKAAIVDLVNKNPEWDSHISFDNIYLIPVSSWNTF